MSSDGPGRSGNDASGRGGDSEGAADALGLINWPIFVVPPPKTPRGTGTGAGSWAGAGGGRSPGAPATQPFGPRDPRWDLVQQLVALQGDAAADPADIHKLE